MTAVSAAPKFTFDLDLAQTADKTRLIGEKKLADMLAEAERKGHEQGLAAGENSATAQAADAVADAVQQLAAGVSEVASAADIAHAQLLTEASQLAVGTARKLAANLIARHPLGEIEALMDDCMSALENVPHLVIRCHPDLADAIKQQAEQKMQSSGFTGRLIVMGEPDIMLGDARLEWVDGGLVRNLTEISAQIDAKLAEFIKTNGAPGTGEKEQ